MKTTWTIFCLAIGLLLALWNTATPDPVDSLGALGRFSAQQAAIDIDAMARAPHPVGSPAHEKVRAYLSARMTKLGLHPQAFAAFGVSQRFTRFALAAPVTDIVGVLPGKNPKLPAIGLMAHYDSVPHSPGAGDDAAGVATVLEIVRALKSGPMRERDVVVVLTDGEELGLLGAEAFFRDHPLAKHVGTVLNFDTRGGGGLTVLFETGANSGGLIERFAQTALRPSALSLAPFVYGHMPNGTDFSVAKAHGLEGLNFAFIGRQEAYHTPYATPARIDLGSVQHMGDQALPLMRTLVARPDVPEPAANPVYFDLFGWSVLHYPPVFGWIVLALAALAAVWACCAGRVSDGASVFKGVLGGVLFVGLPALMLWPLGKLLVRVDHFQRVPLYPFVLAASLSLALAGVLLVARALRTGRLRPAVSLLILAAMLAACIGGFDMPALIAGASLLIILWLAGGRALDGADLWRGSLIFGVIVAAVLQSYVPDAAVLLVWPLLFGALSAIVLLSLFAGKLETWPALLICGLLSVAVVALVGEWGRLAFDALGLDMPAVAVFPILLVLPVCVPLLGAAGTERSAVETSFLMLFAGGVLAVFLVLFGPFDFLPAPSTVAHVQNLDTGKAYRVARFSGLDSWAASALGAEGARPMRGNLGGMIDAPLWYASTQAANVPKTPVTIERRANRLVVSVPGGSGAAEVWLTVRSSVRLSDVCLNGRPLVGAVDAGKPETVIVYAPDKAGVLWTFAAPAHARLEVRLKVFKAAWPAGVSELPPMGGNFMPYGDFGGSWRVSTLKKVW